MDTPLRTTGFGSPAESYAESSIDWEKLLFPKPHAMYSFRITGKKLESLGINDRDIAVVDCSPRKSLSPGTLCVFTREGCFHIGRSCVQKGKAAFDCGETVLPMDGELRIIGVLSRIIRFL